MLPIGVGVGVGVGVAVGVGVGVGVCAKAETQGSSEARRLHNTMRFIKIRETENIIVWHTWNYVKASSFFRRRHDCNKGGGDTS